MNFMLRKLTKLLLLTFLKNYIFNFRHQKTLKMPTKIHDELKVDDDKPVSEKCRRN